MRITDELIKRMTDVLSSLEAELEAKLQAIRDEYEYEIESVRQTLSILQKRAEKSPQEPSTTQQQPTTPVTSRYPRRKRTGVKVLWAFKQLGGGPTRQREVIKFLQAQEKKLSSGAISNAMGRLVEKGELVKDTEGEFPLYRLAMLQENVAQLDFGIDTGIEQDASGTAAATPEHHKNNGTVYETKPWDYPETWAKKIPYVIGAHDRFIHRSEIDAFLRRFEPIKSNSLSFSLSKLYKSGKLIRIQYNSASTLIVYGLPHMVRRSDSGAIEFADPKYQPDMTTPALRLADPQTMDFQMEEELV